MGDWIGLVVFLATSLVLMVVFLVLNRDNLRITSRVRKLGNADGGEGGAGRPDISRRLQGVVGRLPLWASVLGVSEENQTRLRERFIRAGIYSPQAAVIFLGTRLLLTSAGVVLALAVGLTHILPPTRVLPTGMVLVGLGLLVPGLWLDARAGRWQATIRRGLPDAMDMLVLCLEGGASFSAAFQYVVSELRLAHPELAGELEIVQHEMMLGKTPGEAMQKFAQRCDLEDLRTLAGVLLQNERFGVSVAKALRLHADTMRQQRQQRAEEMAQKAAVKILFPTLLCIFPAIFIVVLGPAAFRIMAVMSKMK